jgi:type I restriction enzyme M protein
MSMLNFIKRVQTIMRKDPGVDGDAQRISQLVWLIFLFVYDAKEAIWEDENDSYTSIIPENLRWRSWAKDDKDGIAMTGDKLIDFIDNQLFPTLSGLEVDETTEQRKIIVRFAMDGLFNYMKDGVLLRQIVNIINEIDMHDYQDSHAFNDIYEAILKDLQSAGNAGEFYTPRPVTDFIVEMLNPKLGETFADLACGTGGFLISARNHMYAHCKSADDFKLLSASLFGIEKKPLPHLLAMTNMLLHDIDTPKIIHGNSLEKNVREYRDADKFNVIAMNPPFGGIEKDDIKSNFPSDMRTSETADLFVTLILHRLKAKGRVGIILPDGFLFGNDNAKLNIKKYLLENFNLHTIVRLPNGVFAPYTSLSVNLLFFNNGVKTLKVDYYKVPLPEGLKNGFTKTKQFTSAHLDGVRKWWNNRETENINAYTVTIEEIVKRGYNLDINNPKIDTGEHVFTLPELLADIEHRSERITDITFRLVEAFEGVID